jgi:hypothetical protein
MKPVTTLVEAKLVQLVVIGFLELNTTLAMAVGHVQSEQKQEFQIFNSILNTVTANCTNVFKNRVHEPAGGMLSDTTIKKLRMQGKHD